MTKTGEPGYRSHWINELMAKFRNLSIVVLLLVLLFYCIIQNGLYNSITMLGLILFDIVGLTASALLVQKTLGIHTKVAEHVCGVIEKEGCDTVLSTDGSTFLGIFHWSEVGLGYFGVSLIALLVYPESLPFLAIFNVMCLPYAIWSVTYQRFKAHAWCTLCLTVQGTLWILFFGYLLAGSWRMLPDNLFESATLYVLPICYILAVMCINRLVQFIKDYSHGQGYKN